MEQLIAKFSAHLREASQMTALTELGAVRKPALAVCCGMGGSGIGARLISQYFADIALKPVLACSSYDLPASIGRESLVVICSYSGNTEETLSCMEQAMACGAQICVLSSGGTAEEKAKANHIPLVKMPGGMPPRAAFGYSFVLLTSILSHWQILPGDYHNEIMTAADWLDANEQACRKRAKHLTAFLKDSIPVLYGAARFEGVLLRFRQQLAENSKMLSWHNVFPEMNHNELVGWHRKGLPLKVLMIEGADDDPRIKKRMEVTQKLIAPMAVGIEHFRAEGGHPITVLLHLIHTCDWVSLYLADANGVDAMAIKPIDLLKDALHKFRL